MDKRSLFVGCLLAVVFDRSSTPVPHTLAIPKYHQAKLEDPNTGAATLEKSNITRGTASAVITILVIIRERVKEPRLSFGMNYA